MAQLGLDVNTIYASTYYVQSDDATIAIPEEYSQWNHGVLAENRPAMFSGSQLADIIGRMVEGGTQ